MNRDIREDLNDYIRIVYLAGKILSNFYKKSSFRPELQLVIQIIAMLWVLSGQSYCDERNTLWDEKGRNTELVKEDIRIQLEDKLNRERQKNAQFRAYLDTLFYPGEPSDCAAFDIRETKCLVTIKTLNDIIAGSSVYPGDANRITAKAVKVARRSAIAQFIEAAWLTALSEKYGSVSGNLELEQRPEQIPSILRRSPRIGASQLKEMEAKYTRLWMRLTDLRLFQVYSSSDSVIIDRICDTLSLAHPSTVSENVFGFTPGRFKRVELPQNWDEIVDSLSKNEWSRPFKSEFGFHIVRVFGSGSHSRSTFAKMRVFFERLAAFTSKSVDTAVLVRNYYENNIVRFKRPDTVNVEFLLIPSPAGIIGWHAKNAQDSIIRVEFLRQFTLKGHLLNAERMPTPIKEWIGKNLWLDSSFSYLNAFNEYGVWRYQKVERHFGQGVASLAEVQPEILKALFYDRDSVLLEGFLRDDNEKQSAKSLRGFRDKKCQDYLRIVGEHQSLESTNISDGIVQISPKCSTQTLDSLMFDWAHGNIRFTPGFQ